MGHFGNRRQLEVDCTRAIVNGDPLVVRRAQVVCLLCDWVAEALEVSRRLHHLDQGALDSPHQCLVIHRLSAERAASFVY